MEKSTIKDRIGYSVHNSDPQADVILFGSQARGESNSDSDWDILILVDNKVVTNEIEDRFRKELYEIELETGQLISAFIYPKEYWANMLKISPLFKAVKRDGIRL